MPDPSLAPARSPVFVLIVVILGLGLFVGATAALAWWKPGPDRTPGTGATP